MGRTGTWRRKWERLKAGESHGKLPPRTCPGYSRPEPYRSHDWALVPANPASKGWILMNEWMNECYMVKNTTTFNDLIQPPAVVSRNIPDTGANEEWLGTQNKDQLNKRKIQEKNAKNPGHSL